MRRSIAIVMMLAMLAAGCSNPCEQIAEAACAKAGAESPECETTTEKAARPTQEDLRACGVALELVEALDKVQ